MYEAKRCVARHRRGESVADFVCEGRAPYPVDRRTYDATVAYLDTAVRRAKLGEPDKLDALRRLARS